MKYIVVQLIGARFHDIIWTMTILWVRIIYDDSYCDYMFIMIVVCVSEITVRHNSPPRSLFCWPNSARKLHYSPYPKAPLCQWAIMSSNISLIFFNCHGFTKKYLISGSPWGVPRTAWHLSGLSDELMWPQSLPANKSGPVNLTSLNYGLHWRYGGFLKCGYPTSMGFPTKNVHFVVFWGSTI